jgi:NADPH:quinone reductase
MQAIRIESPGGPETLRPVPLPEPRPGAEEILVEVITAGVNYIDTYQRSGLYPVTFPYVPGLEGAGRVIRTGTDVTGIAVGDLVAWTDVAGSYAEQVVLPAARVVPVPAGVPAEVAAAVMLQGITAHYLSRDTYRLAAGDRCLVHAAAGGVGLLLVQLAKRAGAEVFGTVGSAEKAALARAAGADHVINYAEDDFAAAVVRIAGPRPLDVVYDGVGRSTFDQGLGLLRPRGTMVTFGNASGPVEAVPPLRLSQEGSLYLTRPTLGDHIATTGHLRDRAGELFTLISAGELDVRIGSRFPLRDAEQAHRALEGRATAGKVLLDATTG